MAGWSLRACVMAVMALSSVVWLAAQPPQPIIAQSTLDTLLEEASGSSRASRSAVELELKLYNDEFLIDPQALPPESPQVDPTCLRAIVSGDHLRIEGYSFPLVAVHYENPFFAGSRFLYFADRSARAAGWQEAVASRFEKPVDFPERQGFTLIAAGQSLTQSWRQDDTHYPKAVSFPTVDLFDRRLPVEYLLVSLMTQPERLAAKVQELVTGRTFQEKTSLGSIPQTIFEEILPEKPTVSQPMRVFVDPVRSNSITRVIVPELNGYRQYDVLYEEPFEKSPLPTRCSVYVGASNGDVLGYAEITRLQAQPPQEMTATTFDVAWEEGTYLVDFTDTSGPTTNQRLFVSRSGQRTVINPQHLLQEDVTYASLLVADHTRQPDEQVDLTQFRSRRRWLTTLLQWPWNLVSVVGLLGTGWAVHAGIKQVRTAAGARQAQPRSPQRHDMEAQ